MLKCFPKLATLLLIARRYSKGATIVAFLAIFGFLLFQIGAASYVQYSKHPQHYYSKAGAQGEAPYEPPLRAWWKWTTHDPVAFYTSVLSIVTGFLVVITGGLVWIGYRQETMARTHERAYISGGGPMRVVDAHQNPVRPDEGWITIENYGRTPAVIKRFEWGFCDKSIFPKNLTLSEIIDRNLLPQGTVQVYEREDVIPPHMPFRQFSGPGSFSLSQQNGKIFFGRYIYQDVFHDTHYSTFVLELGPGIGESSSPPGGYSDWN
jgi:hypothetical protein